MNKGPFSPRVLAAARRIGALSVRGNHDENALSALARSGRVSRRGSPPAADAPSSPPSPSSACDEAMRPPLVSNKYKWLEGLSRADIRDLEATPLSIRVPSRNLLVRGMTGHALPGLARAWGGGYRRSVLCVHKKGKASPKVGACPHEVWWCRTPAASLLPPCMPRLRVTLSCRLLTRCCCLFPPYPRPDSLLTSD